MNRVNLNEKTIKRAHKVCIKRDGKNCVKCRLPFTEQDPAEIHHIDGNPNNNPKNGSNWARLHHTCNVLEYYVKKRFDALSGERPSPFEYKTSTKMELSWLRFMIDEISKRKSVSWEYARYTGALEIDGSPETTKRYLFKHVTDAEHPKALFRLIQDNNYNNQIVFTSHTRNFIDQNKLFQ